MDKIIERLRERIAKNNQVTINGKVHTCSIEQGESFECMRITMNDGYISFVDLYLCTEKSDSLFVEIMFADYVEVMKRHEWARRILTKEYNAFLRQHKLVNAKGEETAKGIEMRPLVKTVEEFYAV